MGDRQRNEGYKNFILFITSNIGDIFKITAGVNLRRHILLERTIYASPPTVSFSDLPRITIAIPADKVFIVTGFFSYYTLRNRILEITG